MKYLIPLLFAAASCHPRLPPVSNCAPFVQSCLNDRPHVCSSSRRWGPSGELASCAVVRGVCVGGAAGRAGGAATDAGVGGDQ